MPTGTMNYAPLTISFTSTSKGDGLKHNWDFGDGTTSVKPNPTHTFREGAHTVRLTVQNVNGTSTTEAQIIALPAAKDKEIQIEKPYQTKVGNNKFKSPKDKELDEKNPLGNL